MTRYAKALVALIPALLATLKVLADALANDATVNPQEWIAVAIAGLTALGVYAVPNKPSPGTPRELGIGK